MLELSRPEVRGRIRSQPERLTWGIVDLILAVVMLPFGIWMFIIERLVIGVSSIFDH